MPDAVRHRHAALHGAYRVTGPPPPHQFDTCLVQGEYPACAASCCFESRDEEADRGGRGAFGDQAHHRDPLLWLSMHRRAALAGLAALAAAGSVLAGISRGRR